MKKAMNCFPSQSTEERIKEAARQVFLEKGFDGATSRDIAEAAGINIALTNYYFRSKEKLFVTIFEEITEFFFTGMSAILNKPISLREKIAELIEHDFRMLRENPRLINFILNEVHRNPERMGKMIGLQKVLHHSMLDEQVQREVRQGTIRPISSMHLMTMMVSNIHFLFVSKPMTTQIWNMTEDEFTKFADAHKNLVIDMVTNYLFESEKA
ncbi:MULTISPECIES: TetR/AcrR family transcriptional regulator [Spirosoma]|uniref:TetR/AcrR family transcriptional regulator n=1 Tax=Spirosoma sordidisoli TaxID=2502893 RepID=A0A4V1RVU0_9BACT|nr:MULTISPECIES: TetR/AcrR family transcriptional regulator [Spirosoma]RYC67938.1 TetR/AcrR family transcriptional regulator [Spirosoma sordidisoli]